MVLKQCVCPTDVRPCVTDVHPTARAVNECLRPATPSAADTSKLAQALQELARGHIDAALSLPNSIPFQFRRCLRRICFELSLILIGSVIIPSKFIRNSKFSVFGLIFIS